MIRLRTSVTAIATLALFMPGTPQSVNTRREYARAHEAHTSVTNPN